MEHETQRELSAAVTGATGAIGWAIASELARQDYRVILISRNQEKCRQAAAKITKDSGSTRVSCKQADLSRQSSIQELAASWEGPLDVLINNAAIAPPDRQETTDGIELQFATNVLGYFWMAEYFSSILAQSSPSRVVNVASYWAGGLDLEDLEFRTRSYHNHAAYRQSKQANRMLSSVIAEIFQEKGITVNACHPGDVNSDLSNDLGFGGSQTPAEGARTPIWVATSPTLAGVSGKYFENQREIDCPFARMREQSLRLYQICKSYPL